MNNVLAQGIVLESSKSFGVPVDGEVSRKNICEDRIRVLVPLSFRPGTTPSSAPNL